MNKNKPFYIIVILMVVAVVAIIWYVRKPRATALAGLQAPVQEEASGGETIYLNGYTIDISFLYSYDVDALVANTHSYSGSGIGDKLAPKDIVLIWGTVAEYNTTIDFHWSQSGRWYHWRASSYEEIDPVGGISGVSGQSSNNHLIPANDAVADDIDKIRLGDHIKLKGYLVDIKGRDDAGNTFTWTSSTTRTDTGARSCELIYVTEVLWLSSG